MADPKPVSGLSALEFQWVCKSLMTQRNVLVRSAAKEISGSEIHTLRMREIRQVDELLARLGSSL